MTPSDAAGQRRRTVINRADTLVVGNLVQERLIIVDRLPRANEDALIRSDMRFPGGAAANVAATISMLGGDASLLACVGDDELGRTLTADLDAYGVSTTYVMPTRAETSEFLCIMDDTGARSVYLNPSGAALQLSIAHFEQVTPTMFNNCALVGCRLSLAREIATRATPRNVKVHANVGFWIASGELTDDTAGVLANIDTIFLNRHELELLSPEMQTYLKSREFLTPTRQTVITAGAGASTAYTSDGSFSVMPPAIKRIGNTLGCGDAFMGGYLATLAATASLQDALVVGNRCAADVAALHVERPRVYRL